LKKKINPVFGDVMLYNMVQT